MRRRHVTSRHVTSRRGAVCRAACCVLCCAVVPPPSFPLSFLVGAPWPLTHQADHAPPISNHCRDNHIPHLDRRPANSPAAPPTAPHTLPAILSSLRAIPLISRWLHHGASWLLVPNPYGPGHFPAGIHAEGECLPVWVVHHPADQLSCPWWLCCPCVWTLDLAAPLDALSVAARRSTPDC